MSDTPQYDKNTFECVLNKAPRDLITYVESFYKTLNIEDLSYILFNCLVHDNCDADMFKQIMTGLDRTKMQYSYDGLVRLLNVKFKEYAGYVNYFNKFHMIFDCNYFDLQNTSLLCAIAQATGETLCYYIQYFASNGCTKLVRFLHYLTQDQIMELNNEHPVLLVNAILRDIPPNFLRDKFPHVVNVGQILELVKLLLVSTNSFMIFFNNMKNKHSNDGGYINCIFGVCDIYIDKYSQIYLTDEFNTFIMEFAAGLDYGVIIKKQRNLCKIIKNDEFWDSMIEKHVSYSNMEAIVDYFTAVRNTKLIDEVLASDWDERCMNHLFNAIKDFENIKETIIDILSTAIHERYYNLIKTIIKFFIENNDYYTLPSAYPTLNDGYNANVIKLFVDLDYTFNAKEHLSKQNYKKWISSGKINVVVEDDSDDECGPAEGV